MFLNIVLWFNQWQDKTMATFENFEKSMIQSDKRSIIDSDVTQRFNYQIYEELWRILLNAL